MLGALLLAARLLLDAELASELVGGPWLVAICRRESGCPFGFFGIHEGDRWMERSLGRGFSTRGVHGQVAAFAMPFLPDALAPYPWALDIPLVSAIAATRRAKSWRCRATAGCRSWLGRG